MAKKKGTDVEQEVPQSDTNGNAPATNGHANGNGEKRRPVQSYRCFTDGSTSIEVAVWPRLVETNNGSYTQYSITVARTWRDQNGVWHDSGKDDNGNPRLVSYRAHDIPVMSFLIEKAHAWILDQRTTTADAPAPF